MKKRNIVVAFAIIVAGAWASLYAAGQATARNPGLQGGGWQWDM